MHLQASAWIWFNIACCVCLRWGVAASDAANNCWGGQTRQKMHASKHDRKQAYENTKVEGVLGQEIEGKAARQRSGGSGRKSFRKRTQKWGKTEVSHKTDYKKWNITVRCIQKSSIKRRFRTNLRSDCTPPLALKTLHACSMAQQQCFTKQSHKRRVYVLPRCQAVDSESDKGDTRLTI